ncbi:hypothetical protein FA15DRAFT_702813, partial [Coprinopsis marcescibilis]
MDKGKGKQVDDEKEDDEEEDDEKEDMDMDKVMDKDDENDEDEEEDDENEEEGEKGDAENTEKKKVSKKANNYDSESEDNLPLDFAGSSHASGGLLRGNALGNNPNMADFNDEDMESDSDASSQPADGTVIVWISDKDPVTITPNSKGPPATF